MPFQKVGATAVCCIAVKLFIMYYRSCLSVSKSAVVKSEEVRAMEESRRNNIDEVESSTIPIQVHVP